MYAANWLLWIYSSKAAAGRCQIASRENELGSERDRARPAGDPAEGDDR